MTTPVTEPLPDAGARERALDPRGSFIVQAPAGSGKTGLLIQRLLTLLATVDAPEEVIAITFTRKAAGEVLRRLVDALADARSDAPPEHPHAAHTRALAAAVLARDAERGWDLTENPARLKVYTFDAFCQYLARRMPFLTGLGGDLGVAEPADALYAEAARRVLDRIDEDGPEGAAARRLLGHQDNDRGRAEGLLADMLARRDQWLRQVADRNPADFARDVEAAVARMVAEELLAAAGRCDPWIDEAHALACHAAANLPDGHPIRSFAAAGPPVADPADLAAWRGLAALVLTGAGALRSPGGVNANLGFPPGGGDNAVMKARMQGLLERLQGDDALAQALARARDLPDPERVRDWHVLTEAVGTCLFGAVGHLWSVFAERRQVDYTQVALGAYDALGPEGDPTDLGLILDHRVRHLLVDEFQDTSYRQFILVARLTAGWTPGDGRTLFLVGDPMQSVYGFRDADVALFLKAWEAGIAHLPLEPLRLTANFRSVPAVVDWVNGAFSRIFPERRDLARGRVPYAPGAAAGDGAGEVTFDPLPGRDDAAEAALVVERVRAARAADPAGTVAVLVRGRPHLRAVLPALRAAFRVGAVDIAPLARTPVIVDLMSLARALAHPADRVAWLAVLRAPWCGLTLRELHDLAGNAPADTVWDRVADPAGVGRLPAAARARIERVRAALGVGAAGEAPLSERVEAAWVALRGPAAVADAVDLRHAERFLGLLAEMEAEGGTPTMARLEARVRGLYAETDEAPEVHVLTIHKAKGLEWDTVVLPGLGRGGGDTEAPLLMWLERQRAGAGGDPGSDLLLAPAPERGGGRDPLYDLIRGIARDRRTAEEARLLYVAATRAKQRLHLIGHARATQNGFSAQAGSLLGHLWGVVAPRFDGLHAPGEAPDRAVREAPLPLRRLPVEWPAPEPAPAVTGPAAPAPEREGRPEFSWAGDVARAAGSVAHRAIEWVAREGPERWDAQRVRAAAPRFRAALAGLGMADDDAAAAAGRVEQALVTMLADGRGRWLLGPRPEAASELAVAGPLGGGRVAHRAMDRTFVEDGVRWIVDYKTGRHEGADLEFFLDEEQRRYRPQLEEYAKLMARMDGRPIRLGLYFPAHGAWREWPWAGEAESAEAVVPA